MAVLYKSLPLIASFRSLLSGIQSHPGRACEEGASDLGLGFGLRRVPRRLGF